MSAISKSFVLSYLRKLIEAQNQLNNALELRDALDSAALLFHALMLGLEFRWTATGHRRENLETIDDNLPKFPSDWSGTAEMVSFAYSHPQSTLTFLLKFVKMGPWICIFGLVVEDGALCTLKLKETDIVKEETRFPMTTAAVHKEPAASDWIYKNLDQWIREYQLCIVQKLMPSLNKPGYEEVRSSDGGAGSESRETGSALYGRPSFVHPSMPYFPGEIGRSDLDIFAPMTPSGGMILGPHRPLSMPVYQGNPAEGYRGPRGAQPPSLPPLSGQLPQGARFDPYDPLAEPGQGSFSGIGYGLPANVRVPGAPDASGDFAPPTGEDPELSSSYGSPSNVLGRPPRRGRFRDSGPGGFPFI